MPTSVLSPTHKPTQRLRDFSAVLAQWLRKWARAYSIGLREPIQLTEQDFALYGEALADLTPEQLDAACLKAARTCQFFPKPADILAHVVKTRNTTAALDAELAWQCVLDQCRRFVCADLGRLGPPLPPEIQFAVRAAGGLFFIERCSEEELTWAKRRFIEALAHYRDGAEMFDQLPAGPARDLIASAAQQKSLPPASAPQPVSGQAETPRELPDRGEVHEALEKAIGHRRPAYEPLREEDRERRLQALRRQEAELRRLHPQWFGESRPKAQPAEGQETVETRP